MNENLIDKHFKNFITQISAKYPDYRIVHERKNNRYNSYYHVEVCGMFDGIKVEDSIVLPYSTSVFSMFAKDKEKIVVEKGIMRISRMLSNFDNEFKRQNQVHIELKNKNTGIEFNP